MPQQIQTHTVHMDREGPAKAFSLPPENPRWQRIGRRLRVFLPVFFVTLAIGLGYTFLRPAHYQAHATLQLNAARDINQVANPEQAFYTQAKTLLSRPILEQVIVTLGGDPGLGSSSDPMMDPVTDLERMLSVEPVPGTELVEIRADGDRPELLALVINTLIDVYMDTYERKQRERSDGTSQALQLQLDDLQRQMAAQQQALAAFQDRYDITSMQAENNHVLSKLGNLTRTLDEAENKQREALSQLQVVQQSIGDGAPVLLPQDQQLLGILNQQIKEIESELESKNKRFTRRYLALDPDARKLRERLKDLRQRYQDGYRAATENVLVAARQAVSSSSAEVRQLRAELIAHKSKAKAFEARFEELQRRKEDLAQLDALYKETRERKHKLDLVQTGAMAGIEVIERAQPPDRVLRSDTTEYAVISVVAALLLGLLAVLFVEFLSREPPPSRAAAQVATATWPNASLGLDATATPALSNEPAQGLSQPAAGPPPLDTAPSPARFPRQPRLLTNEELSALWNGADGEGRIVLAGLLSGLSSAELAQLDWKQLDLATAKIHLAQRTLRIPPALLRLLHDSPHQAPQGAVLRDEYGTPRDPADIEALLTCAAVDAGIHQGADARGVDIDSEAVRNTYAAFLVAQGLRLAELKWILGPLPPAMLAGFAAYSPPHAGLDPEAIDTVFPLLAS